MSNIFSESQIEEIKSKNDIVEIVSEFIKLTKKSNNYWAICPFHPDTNPSMSVSSVKQLFKCFVCSAAGNVFIFLMKFKNISFIEAVKLLADKIGMEYEKIDFISKKYTSEQLEIIKANEIASKFFSFYLKNKARPEVTSYLENRGITEEQIKKFNIGFCPSNKDWNLLEYLNNNEISKELAIKSNLVNDKGDPIFGDRIIFPIINEDKKIIGFSGRDSKNRSDIKYLNTNTNTLFKKSEVIYNINNIKNQFITEIIILEGFMDVITLDKLNITNSIAIMGTSFSSYHTNILSKISNRFIVALDNDSAGQNASIKIVEELFKKNLEVKTIKYNSEYKDFNDIYLKEGEQKIKSIFQDKYDYIINYLETQEQKSRKDSDPFIVKKAIDNVNKILNKSTDNIIKNMYSKIIKEKFNQNIVTRNIVKPKKTIIEKDDRYQKQEIRSIEKAVYQIMNSSLAANQFDFLMNMSFFGPSFPEDENEYIKMTNYNKKKVLLEKIACLSHEFYLSLQTIDITSYILNNIEDYMQKDFTSYLSYMDKEDYRLNHELKVYNIYSLVDNFNIVILKELNKVRLNYKIDKDLKNKKIDDLNERIKKLGELVNGEKSK